MIGHTAAIQPLLDKAGVIADAGMLSISSHDAKAFPTTTAKGWIRAREPTVRTAFRSSPSYVTNPNNGRSGPSWSQP